MNDLKSCISLKVDMPLLFNSSQCIDEEEDETDIDSTQIGRSQKSHKELSKDELKRKV